MDVAAHYLVAGFAVDASAAVEAFSSRLSQLSPALQTGLSQRVLPQIFGDVFLRRVDFRIELPFDVLVRIVPIAYRTIRVEEDNIRPSGVVYSPDLRDEAEGARGGGFKQLYETPGWATYDALLRLAATPDFPVPPHRVRELALRRAHEDAEDSAWAPGEAAAVEASFEHAPTTPAELNSNVSPFKVGKDSACTPS